MESTNAPQKAEKKYCKTCKKETAIKKEKNDDGEVLIVCSVCNNFPDAEPAEEKKCNFDADGFCLTCEKKHEGTQGQKPPEKPVEQEKPQMPAKSDKELFNFQASMPMDNDIQLGVINSMMAVAKQFHKAGCFTNDCKNAEQVYVKMQAGREYGLRPMEAMSDLVILHGNVAPWGKGLAKRFRLFGWRIVYKDEVSNFDYKSTRGMNADQLKKLSQTGAGVNNDENYEPDKVTVVVSKNGEVYDYEVTLAEAQTVGGNAMNIDRKAKMRYFGLARIARQHLPEVLGPFSYIAEEITPEMAVGNDAKIDVVNEKKDQLRQNNGNK